MASPSSARIRQLGVAAVWFILLTPGIVRPGVRVEPALPNSGTAPLAQIVREELSESSPSLAALDAEVTLGATSFRAALAKSDGLPLVAAYLTSLEFEAALAGRERPAHITAVFSNPDPLDQLALAQILLGRARVGVFDSPGARPLVTRIAHRGVRTIPVALDQGTDGLLRAADSIDAIIVLPDPAVFNRSNISYAVRSLYQHRKVLIGYSETLTRVGSLASVYPTSEAIARSIRRVLEERAKSGALPPPTFVRDVEVSVNERLARSLNIAVPDRAEILASLRASSRAQEATR